MNCAVNKALNEADRQVLSIIFSEDIIVTFLNAERFYILLLLAFITITLYRRINALIDPLFDNAFKIILVEHQLFMDHFSANIMVFILPFAPAPRSPIRSPENKE